MHPMDSERLPRLYRQMVELRKLDEMLLALKMRDLIMDGFHPYQGQEAVALGAGLWLRSDDVVISNHRPQGNAFAKGTTARELFAEFLGRKGGPSDGIGGPMQFIDYDRNFYCGSIVGSGVSLATGIGLALKRADKGQVAVCFFGDGASNTGSFHEGMNLASIWKLPVVYILENNQYGEAMPVGEFVSCQPISRRADAYNMYGVTVDGMDVLAVAEVVGDGFARVRRGEGPVLIECVTYRFKGHYGGDPEHTYRTKEEIDAWRQKDPLDLLATHLRAQGVSQAELDAIDRAVAAQLEEDQSWALEQPFLSAIEAVDHVWIPL